MGTETGVLKSVSLCLSLSVEWPVRNRQKSGYGAMEYKNYGSNLQLAWQFSGVSFYGSVS